MIYVKNRELKAVRIEVAINLCVKFPRLYPKMKRHEVVVGNDEEQTAENILFELLKLEPCIKYILDFYYKREMR